MELHRCDCDETGSCLLDVAVRMAFCYTEHHHDIVQGMGYQVRFDVGKLSMITKNGQLPVIIWILY